MTQGENTKSLCDKAIFFRSYGVKGVILNVLDIKTILIRAMPLGGVNEGALGKGRYEQNILTLRVFFYISKA